MIGSFRLMGKENYVQVNNTGTLEKLPRLPWWEQVRFAFVQYFKGGVHIDDVRTAVKKYNGGVA